MTFKYDDKQKFSAKVEEFVCNNGGGYIEAVLEVCETENMEPEVGAKLLTQPILEKIQSEGRDYNLLPKGGSLPL